MEEIFKLRFVPGWKYTVLQQVFQMNRAVIGKVCSKIHEVCTMSAFHTLLHVGFEPPEAYMDGLSRETGIENGV